MLSYLSAGGCLSNTPAYLVGLLRACAVISEFEQAGGIRGLLVAAEVAPGRQIVSGCDNIGPNPRL